MNFCRNDLTDKWHPVLKRCGMMSELFTELQAKLQLSFKSNI